jgi:carbohydrate kinase (thermoresistant glucokinase family)
LVVAGVAGSGKSTVARLVAEELGWRALDADTLHTRDAVQKMSSGEPLTELDRWPWLERVAEAIDKGPAPLVVACSALRRPYRTFLADRVPALVFCLLRISPPEAARRLRLRTNHFMPATLLGSQLADLEPLSSSERGFTVDADQPVTKVLEDVIGGLHTCMATRTGARRGTSR